MPLRLILTRHAKSSWSDPLMEDHARPLNLRGRSAATAVGGWLAAKGYRPDLALVSTSERTRETWARISAAFDDPPEAEFAPTLYHAEPEVMLTVLRKATAPRIMMIGHNPGTAYFAQAIAIDAPNDTRYARFPTAATVVVDFDQDDWSKLTWRDGRIVDYVFARDLD